MAGNQIASLFAQLGFHVNYKGLKQFEQSLQKTQKRINSSSGLTGDFKKSTAAQSNFYKEVTRGYAKVKPTLEDHRRNLMRIREGFKQNRLSAEEYRNARLRTLNAISQTEKRMHRERMARIRREQKAQGPFAGGKDPRQRGSHGLISALHSDAAIASMFGGFAAMSSVQSFQQFKAMEQGLTMASGSMEKSQEDMEYLIKLSRRLGVFVGDLGSSFASFSAAARGSSLTNEEVRSTFEGVAAQARVLNLSAADTQGVFRSLVQMMNKSSIMAEELKNQMGRLLLI